MNLDRTQFEYRNLINLQSASVEKKKSTPGPLNSKNIESNSPPYLSSSVNNNNPDQLDNNQFSDIGEYHQSKIAPRKCITRAKKSLSKNWLDSRDMKPNLEAQ